MTVADTSTGGEKIVSFTLDLRERPRETPPPCAPATSGAQMLTVRSAHGVVGPPAVDPTKASARSTAARLEAGLTGDAFADGSITARSIASGVVTP